MSQNSSVEYFDFFTGSDPDDHDLMVATNIPEVVRELRMVRERDHSGLGADRIVFRDWFEDGVQNYALFVTVSQKEILIDDEHVQILLKVFYFEPLEKVAPRLKSLSSRFDERPILERVNTTRLN